MSKIETQEVKEEKSVETAKATQKVKNTKKATSEAVVYVGPQVGMLKKNTTYIKGIPTAAKEMIEKNPAMKKMFVAVSEVGEAKKQIAKENSALNIIYKTIEGGVKHDL